MASAMLDAAPDGIMMVDEDGLIVVVNRQLQELFGYDRQDLVGHNIEMLLPEDTRQLHRAHRTRFRVSPQTRTMGAGLQLSGRRADGAEFPVEISLSPLPTSDGLRVIAAVRDISVRMARESEAREVRRVLDATGDAVLMFDRDTLQFTYVNAGAIAQLGYSAGELLTMTPLHVKPTFNETTFRDLIAQISPGESHSYTTVHRRKDGTDIPVEAILQNPLSDRSNESGWMVSIARDLTRRLELEQRTLVAERHVAILEDRQRIAEDLHDLVIQRLYAAGLGIEVIRGATTDPRISERLSQVVDQLDETIRECRSSIFELSSSAPTPSLRGMVLDVCADELVALGFEPSVLFEGPVDSTGEDVARNLVAVLREALSNVARHAQASAVQVTLQAGAQLVLRVEDNGLGVPARSLRHEGNGLGNMAVRAEKFRGSCQLRAGHPTGSVLEWTVPSP